MGNVVHISISGAIPKRNVDDFSVTETDNDVTSSLTKKKRCVALESFENDLRLSFIFLSCNCYIYVWIHLLF